MDSVETWKKSLESSYSEADERIPQTTDDDRPHVADDVWLVEVCDSNALGDAERGKVVWKLVAEAANDAERIGESECRDAVAERAMRVGWNNPERCERLVHWLACCMSRRLIDSRLREMCENA